METLYVAAAGALIVAVGAWLLVRRLRGPSAEQRASRAAHEAARKRDPPVGIGDTVELGVKEITDHHSGERVAVGEVEGFVVFVEAIPDAVGAGDALRATVVSFNEGHTSADARFEDRL